MFLKIESKKEDTKNNQEDPLFVKEIQKLTNEFYKLMFELNIYNKFNKTFRLDINKRELYGFSGTLKLESGLSFKQITDNKLSINENLECIFDIKTEQFNNCAKVRIINKVMDLKTPYTPAKIKPNEVYLALDFNLNAVIRDFNKACHVLIGGASGSGKTRFLYMLLLNYIENCSPEEVELYLTDMAKDEFNIFEDVAHVKRYCTELEEVLESTDFLMQELNRRKELIAPYRKSGKATNIEEYNKLKGIKKLSYSYLMIDEFSVLNVEAGETKDIKEMKNRILTNIKKLSKLGRSLGIILIVAVQKCVREELPSIIKNMSSIRICFRVNDEITSQVILENSDAVGLSDRQAILNVEGNLEKEYIFTPFLSTEELNKRLNKYKHNKVEKGKGEKVYYDSKANPRGLDLSTRSEIIQITPEEAEMFLKQFKQRKEKKIDNRWLSGVEVIEITRNYDKVNPKELQANANFKYEDHSKYKIVEEKLDLSKSQKPVKKDKERSKA